MSRYKDPRFFLLSTTPCEEDLHIQSSKLPTRKEVLLAFLIRKEKNWKCDRLKKCLFRSAHDTIEEEVVPLYQRDLIPMKDEKYMVCQIINLYKRMQNLMKIDVKKRISGKYKKKIDAFKVSLEKTMPFWRNNALDLIPIEINRQYLIRMQTDRIIKQRAIKPRKKAKQLEDCDPEPEINEDIETEDFDYHPKVNPERIHHRVQKTGELFLHLNEF